LSLSFWLSHQYHICIPLLPHSCYMHRSSHPSWFDYSNYTWRRVQVMKLLIMQYYTKPTVYNWLFLCAIRGDDVKKSASTNLLITRKTRREWEKAGEVNTTITKAYVLISNYESSSSIINICHTSFI
jgi:hypothetical protein